MNRKEKKSFKHEGLEGPLRMFTQDNSSIPVRPSLGFALTGILPQSLSKIPACKRDIPPRQIITLLTRTPWSDEVNNGVD